MSSILPLSYNQLSIKNPLAQREIKIAAKTREEVNFLIGFQSVPLPRGLSLTLRKSVIVAWAPKIERSGSVRSGDG